MFIIIDREIYTLTSQLPSSLNQMSHQPITLQPLGKKSDLNDFEHSTVVDAGMSLSETAHLLRSHTTEENIQ